MLHIRVVITKFTLLINFIIQLATSNDVLEDREVVCSSDRMVVNLSFRRPFNGLVFIQGHFHEEKCKWRGNGGHYLLVVLPMQKNEQISHCGIRYDPTMGEHSAMLIVSPDPQILTQQSLALAVSCAHARKEQMLTLTIGAPSIDAGFRTMDRDSSASLLAKAPPIPALTLRILEGHNLGDKQAASPMNEATIGQRLTLDVLLSDHSIYDMFVHSCIAHDGVKSPDASLMMVDENGCAIRLPRAVEAPLMVFPREPAENSATKQQPKHISVHFYGFQFTSGPVVHFECQLTLCVAPCGLEQCQPQSSGAIRGSSSVRISTRTVKTQLHMRPQILQPIAIAPTMRMERLVAENPAVIQGSRAIYYGLSCTDLAWLLLLSTAALLLFAALWTILNKIRTICVGVIKALKA